MVKKVGFQTKIKEAYLLEAQEKEKVKKKGLPQLGFHQNKLCCERDDGESMAGSDLAKKASDGEFFTMSWRERRR